MSACLKYYSDKFAQYFTVIASGYNLQIKQIYIV